MKIFCLMSKLLIPLERFKIEANYFDYDTEHEKHSLEARINIAFGTKEKITIYQFVRRFEYMFFLED
jgi:hypothetical protein